MLKYSIYGLTAVGTAHLFVLGGDALTQAPAWLGGALWTWDHWGPLADQRPGLVLSGFAFWSTVGSFAIPLIVLGLLLLWMTRRGIVVPRFVGLALLGWGTVATLIMLPSGFPLLVLILIGLCLGVRRGTKAQ
jgi:hypothetical protein